jgi:hypothetical protein
MTTDLRSLFGHAHFASAADTELLARYVAERDDLAFVELLHRHAPAVDAAAQSPPQRVFRNGQIEQTVFCVLHCWDTITWELAWSRPGANTLPNEVAVSPDGKRVPFADMHDGLFRFDGGSGEPKGGLLKLPLQN